MNAASPGICRRAASPCSCCSRCRCAPSPSCACSAPSMPSGLTRGNDRIDAGLIAACVHLLDPVLDPGNKLPPDPRFDALADHLTFIEQIEDDITRIKTRIEHIHDPRLRRIAEADCKRLEQRRERETARLLAELRAHADLARRFDLVCSILAPAYAGGTALTIVVRMPELGQLGREQVAAIAGLAP